MDKMEVVLGPYSLKQMKKSGRISAAAAVMGELMGIRPIITLIDGKTKVESQGARRRQGRARHGRAVPKSAARAWRTSII